MLVRRERIELEQRSVARAAPALARQERLLPWDVQRPREHVIQIRGERRCECAERAVGDRPSRFEVAVADQQRHHLRATAGSVAVTVCQRASDTISPRRSISTPARRRDTPCTPREW